jgi:HemY protein
MTMKAVFWLVGLFAAAAALALLMGQNPGTVTLFWPPYRVDMSFNLVLGIVLALFVLVYLALRSVALLKSLPQQARQWRVLQRERAVTAGLADAMTNQLAGRFVRARSAAKSAIDHLAPVIGTGTQSVAHVQSAVLANLMAAEAAHALQDHESRDAHFEKALAMSSAADVSLLREGVLLRALAWAVDSNRADLAQQWLDQMPQGVSRRTAALRLKLKLTRLTQDHAGGFETAKLLAKHRAFSAEASSSLLRQLRLSAFRDCHDAEQVRSVWKSLDRDERNDPELVLGIVTRMLEVSSQEADPDATLVRAREWLEPMLDQYARLPQDLRAVFVRVMVRLIPGTDSHWVGRIESLQREQPVDAGLMFLAGETFFHRRLWGKASVLFHQAARTLNEPALKTRAWCRLAQLAEERGEREAAVDAWKEAAKAALGEGVAKWELT